MSLGWKQAILLSYESRVGVIRQRLLLRVASTVAVVANGYSVEWIACCNR